MVSRRHGTPTEPSPLKTTSPSLFHATTLAKIWSETERERLDKLDSLAREMRAEAAWATSRPLAILRVSPGGPPLRRALLRPAVGCLLQCTGSRRSGWRCRGPRRPRLSSMLITPRQFRALHVPTPGRADN